jgi:hypothetical protein
VVGVDHLTVVPENADRPTDETSVDAPETDPEDAAGTATGDDRRYRGVPAPLVE